MKNWTRRTNDRKKRSSESHAMCVTYGEIADSEVRVCDSPPCEGGAAD